MSDREFGIRNSEFGIPTRPPGDIDYHSGGWADIPSAVRFTAAKRYPNQPVVAIKIRFVGEAFIPTRATASNE